MEYSTTILVDTSQLQRGEVVENELDAFRVAMRRFVDRYEEENEDSRMYAPRVELTSKTLVGHDFGDSPYWIYRFDCSG